MALRLPSLMVPMPRPEVAAADADLVRHRLFEVWLLRIRWLSLPPGLPLVPLFPPVAQLLYIPLLVGIAIGNLWLGKVVGGAPDRRLLRKASRVGTVLDWSAVLVYLGLSAGTYAHAILPAALLLLVSTTGFRFGLVGLVVAALTATLGIGVVLSVHVSVLDVLTPRPAIELAIGWAILISLTAVSVAGVLYSLGDWQLSEEKRRTRQDADALRLKFGISAREWEILPLLARGFTYQQVASELHISPETVKTHVRHLGAKLEVTGRVRVVEAARRHGLLPREDATS